MGPLKITYLVNELQHTPTWNKLFRPSDRHVAPIYSTPRWKIRLNANDDYVEVWCVPSATHIKATNVQTLRVPGGRGLQISRQLSHEGDLRGKYTPYSFLLEGEKFHWQHREWNRDLQACSAVPQSTAPLRAPRYPCAVHNVKIKLSACPLAYFYKLPVRTGIPRNRQVALMSCAWKKLLITNLLKRESENSVLRLVLLFQSKIFFGTLLN